MYCIHLVITVLDTIYFHILLGAQLIELGRLNGLNDSIPIVLDDVACSGNEVRLIDCNSSKINSCLHLEDVAVHCNRYGIYGNTKKECNL